MSYIFKNPVNLNNLVKLFLVFGLCAAPAFSQSKSDVEKVIETEKLFARTAAEKTVKQAFLEFLTDDALMFTPAQVNGKDYWRARPESPATLTWYPIFADVSSNGELAYTTGRGEFRPKGKDDTTVYYSEFFTVWRKQADGSYKAALDVGISHDKPPTDDKNWISPKRTGKTTAENRSSAASSINKFFDTATLKGLAKSYKTFAAEDVRLLREGKFPITGKANALAESKGRSKITFGKKMTQQSADDLAYVVTTYEMQDGGKTTEKGNVIQAWKFLDGKWQVVFDVFAPIPIEGK